MNTKPYYRCEYNEDSCDWDEYYDMLYGPDGFKCLLTEPEDRNWFRDGRAVVDKLNEQYEEIEKLRSQLRDSEARNATSLEVIRAREQHIEQQRIEIEKLKKQDIFPGTIFPQPTITIHSDPPFIDTWCKQ